MDINKLLSQMGASSNPMSLLMSVLSPQSKQRVNQFQNKNKEEQANEIANICNQHGIGKEDLQRIINMFNK